MFENLKGQKKQEQKIKYKTIEEMYGADDLGNDPIFPGGFINYGYWENIGKNSTHISLSERVQSQENLYKKLLDTLKINREDAVLEIGCGRGYGLKFLHDNYSPKAICGIDLSSHQVERSLQTLKGISGNIRVLQGKAEALPLADSQFTKAYTVEAIQHFSSPELFTQELGRIIEKDGRIAIASFFATGADVIPELMQTLPTIQRGVDKAIDIGIIPTWLKRAAFSEINIESIGQNVWDPFVRWCIQEKPEEVSTNWLDAYKNGLMDYYVITATKT